MPSTEEQRAKWREENRRRYKANPDGYKDRALAYYREHREERLAAMKQYRDANPEKVAAMKQKYAKAHQRQIRAWQLKHKYGMTLEDYEEKLAAQGGVCWICHQPEGARPGPGGVPPRTTLLVVDHDHQTGAYRGLLCRWCNRGLGWFSDDADRFERAAAYLRQTR